MKLSSISFLDLEKEFCDPATAAAVVLPIPHEGGVSYGAGASAGPAAIIEASAQVEFYDELLGEEPCRMGIVTCAPPVLPAEPEAMVATVRRAAGELLDAGYFVAMLGGDHSVSAGLAGALAERVKPFSVIQLDAHADLREQYNDSPHSHACVMARIRELTPHTLQLGIRSLSRSQARRIRKEGLAVGFMHDLRTGSFDLAAALARLPDPVFVTVDVDVFDPAVLGATGTPEPGGMSWYEACDLLGHIFRLRRVVACDLVELAPRPHDAASPFTVARLLQRMLGYRLAGWCRATGNAWPERPAGRLFSPLVSSSCP